MSIRNALAENNIHETVNYELYKEKLFHIREVWLQLGKINCRLNLGKQPMQIQIISLIDKLEKVKDLRFDIGAVDNVALLRFLDYAIFSKSVDIENVYEVLRRAEGGVNPKKYGYGKFDPYALIENEV